MNGTHESSQDEITFDQLSFRHDPTEENRRSHGWHSPHHTLQIISWIVLFSFVAHFYGFAFPVLESGPRIATGIIYTIALAAVFAAAIAATGTDAKDPALIHIPGICPTDEPTEYNNDKVYCHTCQRFVYPSSKHCRVTQKCVDDFDHHCVWLNNTIGRANYKSFVLLLIVAFMLIGCQFGVVLFLLIEWWSNNASFDARVTEVYASGWDVAIGVLAIVFGVMLILALTLILQLLIFHAYLTYNGLTTYEYVCDRQRITHELAPQYIIGTAKERRQIRAEIRARGKASANRRNRIRQLVLARIKDGEWPPTAAAAVLKDEQLSPEAGTTAESDTEKSSKATARAFQRDHTEHDIHDLEQNRYRHRNLCDAAPDTLSEAATPAAWPRHQDQEGFHVSTNQNRATITLTSPQHDNENGETELATRQFSDHESVNDTDLNGKVVEPRYERTSTPSTASAYRSEDDSIEERDQSTVENGDVSLESHPHHPQVQENNSKQSEF